jgi:hypothetical protein
MSSRPEFVQRHNYYNYFKLEQLPSEISYNTIQRAIKNEIYLREFKPTFFRENLMQGHPSSLLYWYSYYVPELFSLAINNEEYLDFFNPFPEHIKSDFKYLFYELVEKLDRIKNNELKHNHLDETKFSKKFN